MIYITGDTHGNWKSRLHHDVFPEGDTLSKNDYVIICGDFGLWHDTEDERFALNLVETSQPFSSYTFCFCWKTMKTRSFISISSRRMAWWKNS